MFMFRHRLLSLFHAPWAIFLVLLIRSLRPFIFIRIGQLYSGRIGHFVPDAAEHHLRQSLQKRKTHDFYYFFGGISNEQWEKMARRNLNVLGSWLSYVWHWNAFIPGGAGHNLPQSFTSSRDPEGLFTRHFGGFPFLDSEDQAGLRWLKSQGWKDGEPFICLLVRDQAYLDTFDTNPNRDKQREFDHRNTDIALFEKSIEWLTSEGVWVVRMGKLMTNPVEERERLIDYAFSPEKSDFLDIWLFANCTGCISTSAGADWISVLYQKPTLFVNASNLGVLFSMFQSIWVPKKLVWIASGIELSVEDHLDNLYSYSSEFSKAGIYIVDQSPEEIFEAVREFWERLTGKWVECESDIFLQQEFWRLLNEWQRYKEYHGWKHPQSYVGSSWLRNIGIKRS